MKCEIPDRTTVSALSASVLGTVEAALDATNFSQARLIQTFDLTGVRAAALHGLFEPGTASSRDCLLLLLLLLLLLSNCSNWNFEINSIVKN